MPQLTSNKIVNHAPEDMLALVADVETYPEFVPYCDSITVIERRTEDDKQVIVVDMTVAYKFLRETFRSKVVIDEENKAIDSYLVSGPLRNMHSRWQFALGDDADYGGKPSCQVNFTLVYEFSSKLFASIATIVFDKFFNRFAAAFETRADQIYGND